MARKKTAVKAAPKSLRQALLPDKCATINFDPENILQITYNPTSKATILEDIPDNLRSEFVLGEGGGGAVTIEALNVTENGTYTAPTGSAYSPVSVSVPQTTITSLSVTENGTYTAPTGSAYSPVTVSVSGSGYTDEQIFSGAQPSGTVAVTMEHNITSYAISGRSALVNLSLNMGNKNFSQYSIYNNTNLEKLRISFSSSHTGNLQNYTASNNGNLDNITVTGTFGETGQAFRNNAKLKTVDIESSTKVSGNAFVGCSIMNALIIRKNTLVPLDNTSAFGQTPFASGGAGGTLYVPESLLSTYQAATNWSTILGYTNNNIAKIEGTIYETQHADGTPVS